MINKLSGTDHLINFELLKVANAYLRGQEKQAFVPGGGGAPADPAAGGDPSGGGGGGAPPMDPAMGGGDPSGGGGGGGGPDPMVMQLQQQLQQMQQQMQQMQQGGGMGGAGGAGGALKPKIDVNVVLTQVVKILARISDHLGIPIPASELIVGQPDLQGMASATQTGGPLPGMDPTAQAGGQQGGGQGAIPPVGPVDPMQGAAPPKTAAYRGDGVSFDSAGLSETQDRAAAIAKMWRHRKAA